MTARDDCHACSGRGGHADWIMTTGRRPSYKGELAPNWIACEACHVPPTPLERLHSDYAEAKAIEDAATLERDRADAILDTARERAAAACRALGDYLRSVGS